VQVNSNGDKLSPLPSFFFQLLFYQIYLHSLFIFYSLSSLEIFSFLAKLLSEKCRREVLMRNGLMGFVFICVY